MKDNFLIMDSKSGVTAKYKHPLSVAFGIDYQTSKTRIVFSAEYFTRINTYHLLEPSSQPFIYPTSYLDSASVKPLIDSYLHVQNASRPVLNAGIGFSQAFLNNLPFCWAHIPISPAMKNRQRQMNCCTHQAVLIFITFQSVPHTISKNILLPLDFHMPSPRQNKSLPIQL